MFHRTGLIALKAPRQKETVGRFEADRPDELRVGDALHGRGSMAVQSESLRLPG
ncbi:hypothetical protein [Streptomyces sp. NPDC017993]|uniref:hypothetical protein n=1 Tax=Streptomyces sp. NPDC017993 TaxID=3365027 RepID=UPI0037ACF52E